jgi:hypothetical protein
MGADAMHTVKPIEQYGSLRAVVRELGVEASVATILRSADQCAFDEARPRCSTWVPAEPPGPWPGASREARRPEELGRGGAR